MPCDVGWGLRAGRRERCKHDGGWTGRHPSSWSHCRYHKPTPRTVRTFAFRNRSQCRLSLQHSSMVCRAGSCTSRTKTTGFCRRRMAFCGSGSFLGGWRDGLSERGGEWGKGNGERGTFPLPPSPFPHAMQLSIDGACGVNSLPPSSVIYMQSSSLTPNSP